MGRASAGSGRAAEQMRFALASRPRERRNQTDPASLSNAAMLRPARLSSLPRALRASSLALLVLSACDRGAPEQGTDAGASATRAAPAARGEEPAPAEEAFTRHMWLETASFEHDFGTVYPQALHHTAFECVAAGDQPLVVREVKYSCGCTAADLLVVDEQGGTVPVEHGKAYPVGTRLRLAATLNTLGRTGDQEQKVTVIFGDNGIDLFTMHAAIEPFLVAEPEHATLENVDPFVGATTEVVLTARNGESFRPTLWRKIQADMLDVELVPDQLGDDGRSARWRAVMRLQPGSAGQSLRPKLIFHADVPNLEAAPEPDGSPAMQRLEFLLLAQVRPVVRSWPEQINMARLDPEEPMAKQLVLHSDDPDIDFSKAHATLLEAREDKPFAFGERCTVTLTPRESPSELGLTFEMRPLPRSGPFSGRIVIELEHPLQESLTIAFQGSMP